MKIAVGYTRVSTTDQSREGVSLEAQEHRLRHYAGIHDFTLSHVYREEGVSGGISLSRRPVGLQMVAEINCNRKVGHVLTTSLDRLFRSATDALEHVAVWDKRKCSLHILNMGGSAIDTASAVGRMFFTLSAAFAEMEKNLIGERIKASLLHKWKNRQVYTRIPPLGYDREGNNLVPNSQEMEVLETVLYMREQGLSMQSIATVLNDHDIPTKLGGRWHAVTIQKILQRNAL